MHLVSDASDQSVIFTGRSRKLMNTCTNQVPISCMIKKRCLKLLGHVSRFPDGADTVDAFIPRLSKHW